MTRVEMFKFIKDNGLSKDFKNTTKYDYVLAKNNILEAYIKTHNAIKDTKYKNVSAVSYKIADPYKAAVILALTYLKNEGKLEEILALVK